MSRAFPVKGLKQLDAYLSALPKNMQRNAYGAGLRAAAKVIQDEARLRAPKDTGKLAASIKAGSVHRNEDGRLSIFVRTANEKQGGNNHSFLGLFFEYGVAPHFITAGDSGLSPRLLTRSGGDGIDVAARRAGPDEPEVLKIGDAYVTGAIQHPGLVARPFMRPALDAKADEAIAAFATRIREFLEKKTGFVAPIGEAA